MYVCVCVGVSGWKVLQLFRAASNTNALETGNEIESGPFGPEQIGTGHGIVFGCWNDFHNFHVVQRCGCGLWLHQQWQQCHYEKCNLGK